MTSTRENTEDKLREAEEKYRKLVEEIPAMSYKAAADEFGSILYVSPQLEAMTGFQPEEWLSNPRLWARQLHPEDRERVLAAYKRSAATGEPFVSEYRLLARDGRTVWWFDEAKRVRSKQGHPDHFQGYVLDITRRKLAEEALRKSEEQLRLSQKLEAVGRLAGGIAHDFNNLLTVVRGYSHLMMESVTSGNPWRRYAEEIDSAAKRASSLTHQLLAFSRKQVLQPKILDLNSVVANMETMLRRVIGEDIDFLASTDPTLGRVKADPSQIEQVIMNLVVNARDAMPHGGKLTIETATVELDESYADEHAPVRPGPFVMLAVSDTGCGMDKETQSQVLEPFFTTKPKGTGLGLSTVYGIVKQTGGYIWIYSEPGHGATFKIYLPRVDELPEEKIAPSFQESVEATETILLVEDDEKVRGLTSRVLQKRGYKIIEAPTGKEALSACRGHSGPIHLLLTDVVMPQMGGRELAEHLSWLHPETTVLYMSGYTDNAIVHHGVLDAGTAFLEKPFTPDGLSRKVREVLDTASP